MRQAGALASAGAAQAAASASQVAAATPPRPVAPSADRVASPGECPSPRACAALRPGGGAQRVGRVVPHALEPALSLLFVRRRRAGGALIRRGGVFVRGALLGLGLLRARARLLVLLARLPRLGHGKRRALRERDQGPLEVEAGLAVRRV